MTTDEKTESFIDESPLLHSLDLKIVRSSEQELVGVANPYSSVLRERPPGRGNALELIREKYTSR